jgi:hypothetical protein
MPNLRALTLKCEMLDWDLDLGILPLPHLRQLHMSMSRRYPTLSRFFGDTLGDIYKRILQVSACAHGGADSRDLETTARWSYDDGRNEDNLKFGRALLKDARLAAFFEACGQDDRIAAYHPDYWKEVLDTARRWFLTRRLAFISNMYETGERSPTWEELDAEMEVLGYRSADSEAIWTMPARYPSRTG